MNEDKANYTIVSWKIYTQIAIEIKNFNFERALKC